MTSGAALEDCTGYALEAMRPLPLLLLAICLALTASLPPAPPPVAAQSTPGAVEAPVDGPAAAQQLLDLVNGLRADHGVGPLQISDVAGEVAFDRSLAMVECNLCSFDHQIPDVGYAPYWEIAQISGALGAGENLGETLEPNDRFVQSLFASWVASPTHYENLLRPQWTHMGLGIVEVPLRSGRSVKVVTQLFVMAGGPLSHA
jgi:uncharacterized protein YkwD